MFDYAAGGFYAEAVGRGGILVAAEAETSDKALAVMNRFELKAPEELLRGATLTYYTREYLGDFRATAVEQEKFEIVPEPAK